MAIGYLPGLRLHFLVRVAVFTACAALPGASRAQDLPVVSYTIKEGLPHHIANRLFLDSQGFLWIGGQTALARFDGERFTTYTRSAGLEVGTGVNDIRAGAMNDLWIATNGSGLYRLDLATRDRTARFTRLLIGEGRAANRVNTFVMSEHGTLWTGTDDGLFVRHEGQSFTRVRLPVPEGQPQDAMQVTSLLTDAASLLVATTRGIYRCPLSQPAPCTTIAPFAVRSMLRGRDGRVWVGGLDGVRVAANTADLLHTTVVNLGGPWRVRRLAGVLDGIIAATEEGHVVLLGDAAPQIVFTSPAGSRINDIVEDAAGNLWIATSDGLVTVRRQGVTLFGTAQGLRQPFVRALRRDRAGRVYVLSEDEWVHRFDGERWPGIRLVLPAGFRRSLWPAVSMNVGNDGIIWLGTANGLVRYKEASFSSEHWLEVAPVASYSVRDGLAGDHIGEIFEDSRGDRWISSMPAGSGETLTIWRKASGRFERLGPAHGVPPFNQPSGFVEDRHGAIWAVLREGGLMRIRDGRAFVFGPDRGLPPLLTSPIVDRDGRLWIGGADTVFRIDDTSADVIQVNRIVTRLGTDVRSLAQDASGGIYLGTYNGLFALNPANGALRHITAFDGLPAGNVDALSPVADGSLLVLSGRTLARVSPLQNVQEELQPRCLFSAISVGGEPVGLPESGVDRLDAVDVLPSDNTLDIEFLAVSPRLGEPLTFEYRLTGVSQQWVRATERRVTYAGLASGRYTFEVRARAASRQTVSQPATLPFTVLPPWYRRWWFLSLTALLVSLAGYRMHRARLARALHTERLRARIATDLHDDIGSSLSQIAILAEVARRRADAAGAGISEPLASIATTSRDLVDAMSDIVWAVNPRTDSLSDLTRRMHRFAEEILDGAGIELTFSTPPLDLDMKLGADLRRELYLILKESVNNIARHSGAAHASVELALARYELTLTISDDGRGFDVAAVVDGNGIASMRKRATAFGAVFTIDSRPGRGTTVSLHANLRRAV